VQKLPHGILVTVVGKFSTTDQSGTVNIPSSLHLAEPVGLVPMGATLQAGEVLSVTNAPDNYGVLAITGGTLGIGRASPGSYTSGLQFALTLLSRN
jgi:hypothetical protein